MAKHKKSHNSYIPHLIDGHDFKFYEKLLNNSNIQAFLLTIRNGEGTLGERGYYKHFDEDTFATLDVNPPMGVVWKRWGVPSSSIGAYQFQNKTPDQDWPQLIKLFDFQNIHKINQDIGALYFIDVKHAIPDILAGNIAPAIKKTKGKWPSLPSGSQQRQTEEVALKFYQDHGGNLNGPGHIDINNLLAGQELPKSLSWNTFLHYPAPDIANHPLSIAKGNATGRTDMASMFTSRVMMGSQKMQDFLAGLKILESGKTGKVSIPKDTLKTHNGDNKKSENGRKNKAVGSLIDLPNANPWALPEYLDNSASLAVSTPWADAGNLVSAVDYLSNPAYMPKVNAVADNYKKYSVPGLLADTAYTQSVKGFSEISPDNKALPNGIGARQLNKTNSVTPASGHAININLNKPMIENFTINVKDGKEGIGDFKTKVEGVLLEILNSANVI